VQTRRRVPWGRLLRRFVVLLALGLLVNAWLGAGPDLSQLRYTGVLQRIALAGLAGAVVVVLLGRRWWAVLAAAVAIAVGWGLVLRDAAADCPGGLPTVQGCAPSTTSRCGCSGRAHLRRRDADPRPRRAWCHAGVPRHLPGRVRAAALLLDLGRRSAVRRSAALLAVAGMWLAAYPLCWSCSGGQAVWTASFLAVPRRGRHRRARPGGAGLRQPAAEPLRLALDALSWPIVALGRNALVLWVGVFVVGKALASTPTGPDGVPLGAALLADHGAVGFFVLTAGSWLALACAMHAARWYVRL
jgi:predicted acyltransferase